MIWIVRMVSGKSHPVGYIGNADHIYMKERYEYTLSKLYLNNTTNLAIL